LTLPKSRLQTSGPSQSSEWSDFAGRWNRTKFGKWTAVTMTKSSFAARIVTSRSSQRTAERFARHAITPPATDSRSWPIPGSLPQPKERRRKPNKQRLPSVLLLRRAEALPASRAEAPASKRSALLHTRRKLDELRKQLTRPSLDLGPAVNIKATHNTTSDRSHFQRTTPNTF
jgi:hypothetical protein